MQISLANRLTLFRILLVPVFVVLFYLPGAWGKFAAGMTFALAAYTDHLDGQMARRRNQVTTLGKVLDPLADKLLVCAPLILFVEAGIIPTWMVLVILGREFAISGLRIIVAGKGMIIPSSKTGKHKTASQMTAIGIILLLIFVAELGENGGYSAAEAYPQYWSLAWVGIPYLVTLNAVFFSVYSGLDYFWKNRHVFEGEF